LDDTITDRFYNLYDMKNNKYSICLAIFVLCMQVGFSQSYKTGDKVEAFINNVWKEVKIVKTVAGKANFYEVQTVGAGRAVLQLSKGSLRPVKTTQASPSTLAVVQKGNSLHLGKYDLYSGIPTMYIGHIVLLGDGKYKVAFGTDENNYEIGNYSFDAASNNIAWLTGLFKNKAWSGKITKPGSAFRIEFNSVTYAESN